MSGHCTYYATPSPHVSMTLKFCLFPLRGVLPAHLNVQGQAEKPEDFLKLK